MSWRTTKRAICKGCEQTNRCGKFCYDSCSDFLREIELNVRFSRRLLRRRFITLDQPERLLLPDLISEGQVGRQLLG